MPEPLERQQVGRLVDRDPPRERAERVHADRPVGREVARLLERLDRGDGAAGVDAARRSVQVPLPAQQLLEVAHVLSDGAAAQRRVAEVLGRVDHELELLLGAVAGPVVGGDGKRVAPL